MTTLVLDHSSSSRSARTGVAGRPPLAFATTTLIGISTVSNLLLLAGPLFMLQIYDRVLTSRSEATLLAFVVLIGAVYLFYGIIEVLRARIVLRLAGFVDHRFGKALFEASVRLRLVPSGSTADPLRDTDTIRSFLAGPGPLALIDLVWVPVYIAFVFVIHRDLGWLVISGALVTTGLMISNEYFLRRPTQESVAATGLRDRCAESARSSAEAVLAMGMLADLGRGWAERNRSMLYLQRKAGDRAAIFNALTRALRLLLQSLVLALGAHLVIAGEMTGGLMIAASVATARALAPIELTIAQWRPLVAARQAYWRIAHILAQSTTERRTRLPPPRARLTVRQLVAGPEGLTPIIRGVEMELRAGDGLGVVGPSGSGKSSLARALCGIWAPIAGEIRLDGVLLQHYHPDQRPRMIGYLPQRVDLFEGTVAQNICRFEDGACSQDIVAAARLAQAHELISSFPEGYDTWVGPSGDYLSAGQRQRVGLARALYGNPFLIVLDEPNANLDAEGDAALSEAIRSVRGRGGIVVVVAHRPSAIAELDSLLFMKAGRQIALGSKAELLRQVSADAAQAVQGALHE